MKRKSTSTWLVVAVLLLCLPASAMEWRTAWSASAQNPYPTGYPTGQPDLSFAFPDPDKGANDQSFRMVMTPTIWGEKVRVRFTNAFGVKPVTIDGVIDFDSATLDPNTGKIKPEYGPDSAIGRAPDWLHPNRAGYLRMAETVNLDKVLGLSAAK